MTEEAKERTRGYGNLYTPSAGPMIIHLQRERGLQHRTIVLSQRHLQFIRVGLLLFALIVTLGAASWVYLASQATRVPFLTRRVAHLQHDVQRLDTLQSKLAELERRYDQVQHMLGMSRATGTIGAAARDSSVPIGPTPGSAPATTAQP